jgi:hypothetical protein
MKALTHDVIFPCSIDMHILSLQDMADHAAHLGHPWAGGIHHLYALVSELLELLNSGSKRWEDDNITPSNLSIVFALAVLFFNDVDVQLAEPLQSNKSHFY